jgi:Lipid A 3-O-deacylase (PagL)
MNDSPINFAGGTVIRCSFHGPALCRILLVFVILASRFTSSQNLPLDKQNANWDFSVWVAGETGEETTNSFAQAQVWTAGVFAGRVVTDEVGTSWRRGRLEYAVDFVPVFETYGDQRTHGIGFDPVILRWNSALHTSRISPYIELSGGGVWTPVNLPPGRTSNFNFMAKGGGGMYLRTRPRQAFDLGLHWSHISNANLGADNYEFNGVQLSVAYHWFR